MFNDHFKFSKNFEFKTNSDLEIYKFRSVKSYMMKNLYKTEEETYNIERKKKREYNKILKSYNNDIKKYISEVKKSFYNSYYNNEEKIRYNNIENLLNQFYEELEKIIDYVFGNIEELQKFNNNLFCELLKLNSILSVSLGSQIHCVSDVVDLNFHELAPSTMYILVYVIISKLYDIDIEKLGFNPDDVEDKAFICITSEKLINVVPVLDFINEIYYKIHEHEKYLTIDKVINNFKKIIFCNRDAETFRLGKKVSYKPDKNINYFCCNSLFDSDPLKYEFGLREKLFFV